jgi:MoaA/NifB/PqqE/SkfB family radical SAM enzyme
MNLLQELFRTLIIPAQAKIGISTVRPFSVGIGLSERCNSQCSMCDFWKKTDSEKRCMSCSEVEHILNQVKQLGVTLINYSAHGEIFVNPEIRDILRLTRQKGFDISLNTNALALANDDLAAFLAKEINPILISIGIDSVDPKTYERVRGIPGGLEKVTQAIENLKKHAQQGISIGAVLLDYNLDDALDLLNFAEQHGLKRVRFTAYQRYFQTNDHVWNRLQDESFKNQLSAVIEQLIAYKTESGIVTNSAHYLRKIPEFYNSGYFFPMPCLAGYRRLDIAENGDVTLCPFIGKSIGNVFNSDLRAIWFSDIANQIRQQMVQGKCPGCWLSCFAEENIRLSWRHGLKSNIDALKKYITTKSSKIS